MKELIVCEIAHSYDIVCLFLKENMGFEILDLIEDNTVKSIQSKMDGMKNGLKAIRALRKQKQKIKDADSIIFVGNYGTLYLMLLNKLGVVRPNRIMWWGFFVHSFKAQKILKVVFKLLYKKNVKFILFSECEKLLYSKNLRLPIESFISVPYGDWSNAGAASVDSTPGNYYFAGGYSNRDYRSLLNVWSTKINKPLVVIGSRNNIDLVEFEKNNSNPLIEILYDSSSNEFTEKLMKAKACIMPFKENTGASGQSVTLRCMHCGKIIIATDTDVMRECVIDGESGFLYRSIENDLPRIIEAIEANEVDLAKMLEVQKQIFETRFSYNTITGKLMDAVRNG